MTDKAVIDAMRQELEETKKKLEIIENSETVTFSSKEEKIKIIPKEPKPKGKRKLSQRAKSVTPDMQEVT